MAGRLAAEVVRWNLHDTSSSDGIQRSYNETQAENKRLRAAVAVSPTAVSELAFV